MAKASRSRADHEHFWQKYIHKKLHSGQLIKAFSRRQGIGWRPMRCSALDNCAGVMRRLDNRGLVILFKTSRERVADQLLSVIRSSVGNSL